MNKTISATASEIASIPDHSGIPPFIEDIRSTAPATPSITLNIIRNSLSAFDLEIAFLTLSICAILCL